MENQNRSITYRVYVDSNYAEAFDTLKAARDYVKNYSTISSVPSRIEIVKQVLEREVINTYIPKQTTVFVCNDLDSGLE